MAGKGSQRLEKKALPRVETAEKSRMAGKRLAKLEKKALPRVETAEKSRMAGKKGEKGATESRTRDLRITSATLYR